MEGDNVLEQRKEFIEQYLKGTDNFKGLCVEFGISEKTGHKWKNRFLEYRYSGLLDQSRAPVSSPNQLDEDAVTRLIKIRSCHPTWGAKKIAILYKRAYPNQPAPSEVVYIEFLERPGWLQSEE